MVDDLVASKAVMKAAQTVATMAELMAAVKVAVRALR